MLEKLSRGAKEAEAKKMAADAIEEKCKRTAIQIDKERQIANEELKAAAAKDSITLPTAVSDKHQKKYDELAAKKGADFDKAYLDAMEDGHKATIEAFQKEADKGNNATLKQWATEKLPTLQHHLKTIQKDKAMMKK